MKSNLTTQGNFLTQMGIKQRAEIISKNLAELKANKVSVKFSNKLVLGADSVIDLEGKIISKPNNRDEALDTESRQGASWTRQSPRSEMANEDGLRRRRGGAAETPET